MVIPKRVLIIGGTHGNEWTGIEIVKNYQHHFTSKFPNLKLEFIQANPEAHQLNCRFKDEDLNRAFQFLHETKSTYEHRRAREIREMIQREHCLVIDLHTTTANMGKTIILPQYNPLILSLCEKLTAQFHDCRIIGAPDPNRKYVASQSEFGLMVEVGPVANGVVEGVSLESTFFLIQFILELVDSSQFHPNGSVEIYEETQDVHYPVNEKGERKGYIHSDFQGKDFQSLKGEFVAFKSYEGDEIKMKVEEELYPIFINEAAYYPQQLAFTLCRKKMLNF